MEEEVKTLKIGDLITLKNLRINSFICAEGILLEDVHARENLVDFADSLFAVHLQRQYSASREYEDFMRQQKSNPEVMNDLSSQKYKAALQRGKDNELKLNENYMSQKMCSPIVFGDIIQLMHVKSGKFLTVVADELAKVERENLRLVLSSDGTANSWLQLMPRYKIDREGDDIKSNTEMLLKVAERTNEYIHCADKDSADGNREVNCSLELSSYKVTIFQSSADAVDTSLLLYSDVVIIHDPETQGNLTLPIKSNEKDEEAENAEEVTVEDMDEAIKEAHIHETVITVPKSEGPVDTNSLWIIEAENANEKGGPIDFRNEKIRFRHVNSGKYLQLVMDGGSTLLHFTDEPDDSATLFLSSQLYNTDSFLFDNKPLQLQQAGQWIVRGPVHDEVDGFTWTTSAQQGDSLNILISRYDPKAALSFGSDSSEGEPLDLHVCLAARYYFKQYLSMIVIPDGDYINTLWPGSAKSDIDFYKFVCRKMCQFIQGVPISTDLNEIVDLSDDTKRTLRQSMFREQGFIQVLLQFANNLVVMSRMAEEQAELIKKKKKPSMNMQGLLKMSSTLLEESFSILFELIKNHPENQMYTADFMPVLLNHLNSQPIAGKCVTEMLGNNMELQETKIGVREIRIFVDQLRASSMNKMYLELLRSCCSCQGNGVDGNQCKVADMVFSNLNDIIIQIHADYSKVIDGGWNKNGLYIPKTQIPGQPVKAEDLLRKGLPSLALSWTTSSIELSPLGLFGKLSVPVEELYRVAGAVGIDESDWLANPNRGKKSTNASAEQKDAVKQYFISEMYLGAEMCLDRNYVAMHKLDDLFPYDVLITILKMDVDDELKAAAVRLLLCLHVDRDPQSISTIPCLTRTWSELAKSNEIELPYVEPARRSMFSILQQIVAEHIDGMKGNRWSELSLSIMDVLLSLVKFNFYGTTEKIRDVIDPLLSALDRRGMQVTATTDETQVAAKPSLEREDSLDMNSPSISRQASNVEGGSERYLAVTEEEAQENEVKAEVEAEEESDPLQWFVDKLDFLESFNVLIAILVLVLVAVILLGLETGGVIDGSLYSPLWFVNLVIFAIFLFEYTARCSLYRIIHGVILEYMLEKFNLIDLGVILVDLVFLILGFVLSEESETNDEDAGGEGNSSAGGYAKAGRLLRAFRFMRMLRAARVLTKLNDLTQVSFDNWIAPLRYRATPKHEIATMIKAVEILTNVQKIVDDRNLSIFLRAFHEWEQGKDTSEPDKIFEKVISKTQELTMTSGSLNDIFIDVLMFNDGTLMQGALDIVVATNSMRDTLLSNAKNVQLLVSKSRERQFRLIDEMLLQLERNAETQELWGCLESAEDRLQSKQTYDFLFELIDACRKERDVLEFDEKYKPDPEIQDLLRNLGCFDICFKVFGLMETIEEEPDGSLVEEHENTKRIVTLCNELMYWFFLDNPANQELGFERLDFFLESLDDEVGSHHCIKAIFKNNERLMRLCSHSYLEDMVQKIIKNGKRPEYLSIMTAISHVGELNIVENQFEIIKQLASPSRLPKVMCFLCPTDHIDYLEKVALMEPFQNTGEVNLDDLHPKLAYHLTFLEVLSGCTVGRINITTVEAKVQSIFNFKYILDALLDKRSITIAKTKMGLYFFNAIVEVEMLIPLLEQSAKMWALLETAPAVFAKAKDELRVAEKYGWDHEDCSRQRIEFTLVMVMIVGGFFERYYNPSIFKNQETSGAANAIPDRVALTSAQVEDLIHASFQKIKELYALNSPRIATKHKAVMYQALVALNKSAKRLIDANIEPIHEREDEDDEDEVEMTNEQKVHAKYAEFIEALEGSEELQENNRSESFDFIGAIEALPFIADEADADVRYEPFIRKLVSHVKGRLTVINGENRLDARCTRSTIWLIRALRTMIENKWGMTIDERDDDGGEEQDEASAAITAAFDKCGVSQLCLDLITIGIDAELQLEAVKLCVAMLFKEGGAKEVQETMYNHLSSSNSDLFFRQVRKSIQELISWHKWHGIVVLEEDEDADLPPMIILVRFIQLMSEGHYEENQDITRDQPGNQFSYNLLDDFVQYANVLSRLPCKTSTDAAIRVTNTILEVIQGPCVKNQEHFALNTELIETLNRMMRAKAINDCEEDAEIELKMVAVDIFQGLLEGQGTKSSVYERVLSVIHLDIIQILADPEEEELANPPEDEETAENLILLRTECLVLLQMLFAYKPALREELGMTSDTLPEGVACVEVLWRGELQRRFFHIPNLCANLAKASKDKLVEDVDRSNQENKLLNFLYRAEELYREMNHQNWLNEKGWNVFASNQILDSATWFTFFLAIAINTIFVVFYTHKEDGGAPVMPREARNTAWAINLIQLIGAIYVMAVNLIVRSPVKYQTGVDEGLSNSAALLQAVTEPITLYYFGYLGICFMGFFGVMIFSADGGNSYEGGADFFMPLLLLDIIKKNSTTRDVLNAVVYPRKQLGMTLILGAFVIYIFAFFIFYYFRNHMDIDDDLTENEIYDDIDFCANLWDCFKTVTSYGMRNPEGIGGWMVHDINRRFILDFLYFVVVLIVLLNVIFGIIIDTFSDLRSKKEERITDTNEICFICGIDKQIFDRASDEPNGFKRHLARDHNMWAYLYFIVFIWEQDKDDDDGMELYVRKCIEANDLSWFPMNKAMCLTSDSDEGEQIINAISDEMDTAKSSLIEKLTLLQTEMSGALEDLSVTINSMVPGGRSRGRGRPRTADGETSAATGDFSKPPSSAIQLQIQEVTGINLPSRDLEMTQIELSCEFGNFEVNADRVVGSRILFAPDAYPVGESLNSFADCSIVIKSGSMEGRLSVSKDDLDSSKETRIVKNFSLKGQQATCKIVIIATTGN